MPTPGTPNEIVPEGGSAYTPATPPELNPETPGLPDNPSNYIRKADQVNAAGATRTFLYSDIGNYVRRTHTGGMTDTVPANATTAFPVNTIITIRNTTAAQVLTLAAAGGVTLNGQLSIAALGTAQLWKVGTNEWDIL